MKFEEYQKLASLLNEARNLLYDNHISESKTSLRTKHWRKASDAIDIARSESEELMFLDFPEEATTDIFYPAGKVTKRKS